MSAGAAYAPTIPSTADVIITFVLYAKARDFGLPPFRTALLYALNPVSIYVSAIHGNFDAIPAFCTMMAVLAKGNAAGVKLTG